MPKPKNKLELINQSQEKYAALLELINSYTPEQLSKDFSTTGLNRNVRDVVAHLNEWHLFIMRWYKDGMQGKKPDMPASGYTWKTLPALNIEINKKYKDLPLANAQAQLAKSYKKVQKIIEKHTNEELFEKKKYAWTGSTSLGAYLIMNTWSHYSWAIKLIKKSLK